MTEASLSSSSVRTTVTNTKFEVEKFDSINNFGMWQCEVLDVCCANFNVLASARIYCSID